MERPRETFELAGLIDYTISLQKPEDGNDFGLDDRGLVLLLGNCNGIRIIGFDPSPVLLVEIGGISHHHAVQELLLLIVLLTPEQNDVSLDGLAIHRIGDNVNQWPELLVLIKNRCKKTERKHK
jgi:hypothetical protein